MHMQYLGGAGTSGWLTRPTQLAPNPTPSSRTHHPWPNNAPCRDQGCTAHSDPRHPGSLPTSALLLLTASNSPFLHRQTVLSPGAPVNNRCWCCKPRWHLISWRDYHQVVLERSYAPSWAVCSQGGSWPTLLMKLPHKWRPWHICNL